MSLRTRPRIWSALHEIPRHCFGWCFARLAVAGLFLGAGTAQAAACEDSFVKKGNQVTGLRFVTASICGWLTFAGYLAVELLNQMPAQGDKFSTPQIKVLAAYVWGFSNKTAVAGN